MISMKEKKKYKKKVKRKVRKIYISTVAIILATVTVIFCSYNVMYKTNIFDIIDFNIEGNTVYSDEYLIERTGINLGEKLFSIDRKLIEEVLEREVYVENCTVSYFLPNKISIRID